MQRKPHQGTAKPLHDPQGVFTHARRFMLAEERLRSREPDGPTPEHIMWLALPVNVLSAFACELFLKSLLLLDGKNPTDSHNLGALFKHLHNKKKDRLSELWDISQAPKAGFYDAAEKLTGRRPPSDLRGALVTCSDAFTQMRYYYEDTSRGRYYLNELPRILHGYILELKPEWR